MLSSNIESLQSQILNQVSAPSIDKVEITSDDACSPSLRSTDLNY